MSKTELTAQAHEICTSLAKMDFSAPGFLKEVRARWPETGPAMTLFSERMRAGLKEGWLCDRANGALRFSRLFKPSPESADFSADAVYMPDCAGPRHTHPNGELSWCIAMEGTPLFDGFGAGWALYGPGTTHVPTVRGGTMLILYFLPGGAMEWV